MTHGEFVWCDLSARDVEGAVSFYGRVLGWSFEETRAYDGSPYYITKTNGSAQAAIYKMPSKFMAMELPSFWMSYIRVDSVLKATKSAAILGGTSEIEPTEFGPSSKIALIRDPSGAGFTVYEGDDLPARLDHQNHGAVVWNALHVTDADAVIPFYETLLGWRVEQDRRDKTRYRVFNSDGKEISEIRTIEDTARGNFQYWAVYIAVDDLKDASLRAIDADGTPADEETTHLGTSRLIYDRDGAGVFLCQSQTRSEPRSNPPKRNRPRLNVDLGVVNAKTWIALGLLWLAVSLGQNWVWGIIFMVWVIPALKTGETYLVEPITRNRNPILFWLIVATWMSLGLLIIVYDLPPLLM